MESRIRIIKQVRQLYYGGMSFKDLSKKLRIGEANARSMVKGVSYRPPISLLMRKYVWLRDDNKCVICDCKNIRRLCIHHIDHNYRHNVMENLVTVCKVCHGKIHHLCKT